MVFSRSRSNLPNWYIHMLPIKDCGKDYSQKVPHNTWSPLYCNLLAIKKSVFIFLVRFHRYISPRGPFFLPKWINFNLSLHPSIHPSIDPSIYLSVCLLFCWVINPWVHMATLCMHRWKCKNKNYCHVVTQMIPISTLTLSLTYLILILWAFVALSNRYFRGIRRCLVHCPLSIISVTEIEQNNRQRKLQQ